MLNVSPVTTLHQHGRKFLKSFLVNLVKPGGFSTIYIDDCNSLRTVLIEYMQSNIVEYVPLHLLG